MRKLALGLIGATWLMATPALATEQSDDKQPPRASQVRSRNMALRDLFDRGYATSPTFRLLVDAINASDGIVYLDAGECRHGVRACLVNVTTAGTHRMFFVKVDVNRKDRLVMAAIGHELQHVLELLSDPNVTSYASMYFFYKRNQDRPGASHSYETDRAVKAGEAIAGEVRRFRDGSSR